MAKTRAHASWNGLSPQQRQTLEEWLFEDGLSYNEALKRAKRELGYKGERSSLRRFYEERNRERMLLGFAEAGKTLATVEGTPVSLEALRETGMKVAAQIFFKLVTERPEQMKDWLPLARLLANGEKNQAWRRVKDEENEIRREALDLARTKFHYDTVEQALEALPQLQEMELARLDPNLAELEYNRRLNKLRQRLFGEAMPELLPETPEEKAHPELVERKMHEAQQRQRERWARKNEAWRQELAERQRQEQQRMKVEKPGEPSPTELAEKYEKLRRLTHGETSDGAVNE
jgi:hypothetical protein